MTDLGTARPGSPPTALDVLQRRSDTMVEVRGAPRPTGFRLLDDVLRGGFHPGELVLVGGRPGIGKTVAALQWARSCARTALDVLYVCYEHSPDALLGRLLALELGCLARPDEIGDLTTLRDLTQEIALGAAPMRALTSTPLGEEAYGHVASYGARLHLVEAGSSTGINEIADLAHRTDPALVIVDYLQKVAQPGAIADDNERTTRIVEALKETAIRMQLPLVALAAADREGLTARRMRLHHLRGSTALAHEPDVVILLNDKSNAVSKSHLAYDPVRADRYRQQVVFSVEKNRSGPASVDLEFRKDFASFRFHPEGGFLTEKLVDDVLYDE
jgi:replicative DNA helicase